MFKKPQLMTVFRPAPHRIWEAKAASGAIYQYCGLLDQNKLP
jgi:hypothetical protein